MLCDCPILIAVWPIKQISTPNSVHELSLNLLRIMKSTRFETASCKYKYLVEISEVFKHDVRNILSLSIFCLEESFVFSKVNIASAS